MSGPRSTPMLVLFLSLAAWPVTEAQGKTTHVPQTPWYDGLGRYERRIQTAVEGAQGYFNQGMVFLMAGNAEEARRSFEEAARFDPRCAMAHWGIALAQGPHLGRQGPSPKATAAAVAALNRAHELAAEGPPMEQALIQALGLRHRDPPSAERRPLDEAFAAAMAGLQRAYPQDADVHAWAAEAHLIAAQAQDDPKEAERFRRAAAAAVDAAVGRNPDHPLANRISVLCALHSNDPERGDSAAERLRQVAPGVPGFAALAVRHDARRGRWSQAIETGLKVLAADARYLELTQRTPEHYRLDLARHRVAVVHAAVMSGRQELALEQAQAVVADLPAEWLQRHRHEADGLTATPVLVLVKFGQWEEALAAPPPAEFLPFARVLHHAARGLAQVERGDLGAARQELATCERLGAASQMTEQAERQTVARWAHVAQQLLTCRLLLAEGRFDEAVAGLEAAVQEEESWRRPLDLPMLLPARHALAAALLQADQLSQAAQVYETDLERWPENGWALGGLLTAKVGAGEREAAAAVRQRWLDTWKTAALPRLGWAPVPTGPGHLSE